MALIEPSTGPVSQRSLGAEASTAVRG